MQPTAQESHVCDLVTAPSGPRQVIGRLPLPWLQRVQSTLGQELEGDFRFESR